MNEVYFIASSAGTVKIGTTADHRRRMVNLNSSNGDVLDVLAVVPGGLETEAHFHEKFAHLHVKGEWFRDCPEIREFAATLAKHGRDVVPHLGDSIGTVGMVNADGSAIAAEMKSIVLAAAEPVAAGESIKAQMRRSWEALGRPEWWRFKAAWYCDRSDGWSAVAVEEFRQRDADRRARQEALDRHAAILRAAYSNRPAIDAALGEPGDAVRRLG